MMNLCEYDEMKVTDDRHKAITHYRKMHNSNYIFYNHV